MQLESKRNIAKYILAFGSVQGLNIAIGVVRTKLVALLLGPNGMGIMSLYNSAVQMVQSISYLGLDKSGVPSISKAYETGKTEDLLASVKMVRSLFMMAALLALTIGLVFCWLFSLIVFSDTSHTLHFIALTPAAPMLIIISGEIVILKTTRQLKRVALLYLLTMMVSLICSVILFYLFGAKAIIPSIVITAFAQLIVTMVYSYKRYRPQISLSKETIKQGRPLITMGVVFTISALMVSGSEFIIRSFLYSQANETVVGLYNTAYLIAYTYAGTIFAAFDSEYYPRLSQIGLENKTLMVQTIRRQIRVSLSLAVPMAVCMYFLLPVIVPLLFSDLFVSAVPMAQIVLFCMVFRAISLPIGYIPLAINDQKTFMTIEIFSAVCVLGGVIVGYNYMELIGCGYGLLAANMLEVIFYLIICQIKYGINIFKIK